MKRFFLVMFGLTLIAICASWFLGVFDSSVPTVTSGSGFEAAPDDATSSMRSRRPQRQVFGGLDLNTVLNFANAIIGFVGLIVTYKASRGNSSTTSA